MIEDFHFLRPWAWLALLPLGLLAWALWRQGDGRHRWQGIVAPHLLPYLLTGESGRKRSSPWAWMGVAWLLAVVAVAGPTWRREPSPFADDTAAMAIVVKVTPSMMTEDIPPARLARATQKIQDLLERRQGAKTSLIAYAGSAHVVMPATSDEGIINTFAAALDPKVMPLDGDAAAAALKLADETLAKAGGGSIAWMTDSLSPDQAADVKAWRQQSSTLVQLLPMASPGDELTALLQQADAAKARVVRLAADDSDVAVLARAARYVPVAGDGTGDRWQEAGYWLVPLLAALTLLFFRRGWMIPSHEPTSC